MLTLYFAPGASSFAPHIALHEIGVPFEARPMSFKQNDMRSPDYLALNPEGKVPTPRRRRASADRSRRDPVLSCQTLSRDRVVAAGRYRGRSAGLVLDVVHCLHAAPGAAARAGLRQTGLWHRRPAPGQWLGDRPLFDRRHPSVPAVLAAGQFASPRAWDVSESYRALRTHDGAAGRAAHDRGRERGRVRVAGVTRMLLSSPAKAGDPVRRGFSIQSLTPLECWIIRLRG